MADKLLIVLANTEPGSAGEVGAPLFQATVAASMEYEVEMILTGRAAELARHGFASRVYMQQPGGKSAYDVMREAHQAGVVFKFCPPPSEGWDGELIPEIDETVGAAYLISEAMSEGTVTFTY